MVVASKKSVNRKAIQAKKNQGKEAQKRLREEQIRLAEIHANEAYTYYIALIADVAIQLQDELFENYIGGKTYHNDEKLRMILDQYKVVADKHYEWYNDKVKEPAFYADLRDGVQKHLKDNISELFSAYSEAFKKAHCAYSRMVAMVSVILVIIKSVEHKSDLLRKNFAQLANVRIMNYQQYLMSDEFNYVEWICNTYGKDYPDECQETINKALRNFVEALEPNVLIKASAEYAFQYHPDKADNFKYFMGKLFKIDWK